MSGTHFQLLNEQQQERGGYSFRDKFMLNPEPVVTNVSRPLITNACKISNPCVYWRGVFKGIPKTWSTGGWQGICKYASRAGSTEAEKPKNESWKTEGMTMVRMMTMIMIMMMMVMVMMMMMINLRAQTFFCTRACCYRDAMVSSCDPPGRPCEDAGRRWFLQDQLNHVGPCRWPWPACLVRMERALSNRGVGIG